MQFHFILALNILLHVGSNRLKMSSSHHHGSFPSGRFGSFEYHSTDNCTGPTVVCEHCNRSWQTKNLFLVLCDHILPSTLLLNYLDSDVLTQLYSQDSLLLFFFKCSPSSILQCYAALCSHSILMFWVALYAHHHRSVLVHICSRFSPGCRILGLSMIALCSMVQFGGIYGVMAVVIGTEYGDLCSKLGQVCFDFTYLFWEFSKRQQIKQSAPGLNRSLSSNFCKVQTIWDL